MVKGSFVQCSENGILDWEKIIIYIYQLESLEDLLV